MMCEMLSGHDSFALLTCTLILIGGSRPYEQHEREWVGSIGALYFVTDSTIFKRKDILFHHITSLWIMYMCVYHPYPAHVFLKISQTEWSTLFLILNNYATGRLLTISQFMFVTLFFRFRMVGLCPLYLNELTYMQAIPLVSLYGLNVYWFRLICKKVRSTLKRD